VAAVLATTLAGPARAQEPAPDPGSSAVDQYVELVPTGSGPKSPGVEKERKTPLAPKAKRALDKTTKATADALSTIATSSNYGAPTPGLGAAAGVPSDAPSPTQQPSLDRTIQATAAAAAPVDDARMIVLLVALLATAVAGGVLAARRRRM
jgi:hypothetical protein